MMTVIVILALVIGLPFLFGWVKAQKEGKIEIVEVKEVKKTPVKKAPAKKATAPKKTVKKAPAKKTAKKIK